MAIGIWPGPHAREADFGTVRLLAVDIDGTLTDGLLQDDGKDALGWTQSYHVRDGEAIKRLAQTGTPVVPISCNTTRCAREQMAFLGLPTTWIGEGNKSESLKAVMAQYNVPAATIAYVADGPEDVAVFASVGLGCAVADADAQLIEVADFISSYSGGRGAVSDVVERILAAQCPSPKLGKTHTSAGRN